MQGKGAGEKSGDDSREASSRGDVLEFSYIKTGSHRVIHVDGMVGSITPSGDKIAISPYSERFPIPKAETLELKESGATGQRLQLDVRSGIVRQVETTMVMDMRTLGQVVEWLQKKKSELAEVQEKIREAREKHNG